MLRDLFSNRLFIGGLAFFIFCVGGSLLYMQHVERETAREMAAHEERIKQLTEKPKPTTVEAPVGEPPQQGGHVHADGTFHAEQMTVGRSETKIAHTPSTNYGILQKIGKFNVFENHISELPLPNQAELENYWTLEKCTAAARKYWEERGGLEISDEEFNHEIQKTFQDHLDEYGVPPAPPGYTIMINRYIPATNRKAYYSKKGEVYIDLVWGDEYGINTDRLSSEEWEIYKILKILTPGDTSFTVQPIPEDYAAVARRWAQELEDSTFGPIPTNVSGGAAFDEPSPSTESVNAMSQQKANEIRKAFRQYWGFASRPPEKDPYIDIQLAGFVLGEIVKRFEKGER